jgi:hypothetical protein
MRKTILCFIILAGTAMMAICQPSKKIKYNKYQINLPGYWKPGNKVWQILSDKLPEVCDELKGKELCGDDCNPKYTVEFYMSAPVIYDYYPIHISSDLNSDRPTEAWDIITYYGFQGFLLLYDNTSQQLLTKIVITDTNEVWQVKNRATLLAYAPPRPSRLALHPSYYNASTGSYINTNMVAPASQSGQTPFSYINNNREKLSPAEKDLLAIIDEKIRSL